MYIVFHIQILRTRPCSGLNLWVQLNNSIYSVELYKEALLENIFVIPGLLCSVSGKYRNCIRLGRGKKLENTIKTLGQIMYDLIV